jgi:hypothetical protein
VLQGKTLIPLRPYSGITGQAKLMLEPESAIVGLLYPPMETPDTNG